MRVTALLFNPPGRGEFLRKLIDMPDAAMPTKPAEFRERSLAAVKHFWPSAQAGKANELRRNKNSSRVVVDGDRWSVEWALDEYQAEVARFVADSDRDGTCVPHVLAFSERCGVGPDVVRL